MNILPKKRWHVRTKENIARVRRDEAEANAKEQEKQGKLEFAESEARINFLRKKCGVPERQSSHTDAERSSSEVVAEETGGHVNLFADYKAHIKTTNKDLEKEKKEEQEKYEKQIGYLTYLGQDTNEALKLRSWYEVAPKRTAVGETINEKDLKLKHAHDPLTLINSLLPPDKKPPERKRKIPSPSLSSQNPESDAPKNVEEASPKAKKHSKEKKHKKEKSRKNEKSSKKDKGRRKEERRKRIFEKELIKREKLDRLRKERLRREASERARQDALLAPKEQEKIESKSVAPTPRIVQKYNSQFNPELAKQNML